jgi:diacylglycerol kinase family enzyme
MWAGIGLDAAITQSVSPEEKRAIGSWAFLIPTLDTLQGYPNADVRLTLDDRQMQVSTSLIVVSNIQLYGAVLPLGAKACLDDGLLDVCIFKGEGLLTFVRHVFKILSRRHLRDPAIEYYQCRQVVVESTRPLPVHADDETFTRTPVTIRVLPRALKVIVPQNTPAGLFRS